jgi:hypothetical protein
LTWDVSPIIESALLLLGVNQRQIHVEEIVQIAQSTDDLGFIQNIIDCAKLESKEKNLCQEGVEIALDDIKSTLDDEILTRRTQNAIMLLARNCKYNEKYEIFHSVVNRVKQEGITPINIKYKEILFGILKEINMWNIIMKNQEYQSIENILNILSSYNDRNILFDTIITSMIENIDKVQKEGIKGNLIEEMNRIMRFMFSQKNNSHISGGALPHIFTTSINEEEHSRNEALGTKTIKLLNKMYSAVNNDSDNNIINVKNTLLKFLNSNEIISDNSKNYQSQSENASDLASCRYYLPSYLAKSSNMLFTNEMDDDLLAEIYFNKPMYRERLSSKSDASYSKSDVTPLSLALVDFIQYGQNGIPESKREEYKRLKTFILRMLRNFQFLPIMKKYPKLFLEISEKNRDDEEAFEAIHKAVILLFKDKTQNLDGILVHDLQASLSELRYSKKISFADFMNKNYEIIKQGGASNKLLNSYKNQKDIIKRIQSSSIDTITKAYGDLGVQYKYDSDFFDDFFGEEPMLITLLFQIKERIKKSNVEKKSLDNKSLQMSFEPVEYIGELSLDEIELVKNSAKLIQIISKSIAKRIPKLANDLFALSINFKKEGIKGYEVLTEAAIDILDSQKHDKTVMNNILEDIFIRHTDNVPIIYIALLDSMTEKSFRLLESMENVGRTSCQEYYLAKNVQARLYFACKHFEKKYISNDNDEKQIQKFTKMLDLHYSKNEITPIMEKEFFDTFNLSQKSFVDKLMTTTHSILYDNHSSAIDNFLNSQIVYNDITTFSDNESVGSVKNYPSKFRNLFFSEISLQENDNIISIQNTSQKLSKSGIEGSKSCIKGSKKESFDESIENIFDKQQVANIQEL